MTFIDTHIAVAIAAGKFKELSKVAVRALDKANTICVSPLVVLELHFLWEIQRIRLSPAQILAEAERVMAVQTRDASLSDITVASAVNSWTRDPFDRMIVGHAQFEGAPLVTKDENILKHYKRAVW